MPMPIPMPMPICSYRNFQMAVSKFRNPWILSVSYGKDGVSSRDEKFVWFSILFNAYQAFWQDFQFQQDKPYLAFACSKAAIKTTRYEICRNWNWKLKLKNKYTETTLSNGVLCLYCYLWTYFLLSSVFFNVDFEDENDEWGC